MTLKKLLVPFIAALALCAASVAQAAPLATKDACPTDVHQILQNANLTVNLGGTSTATFTIPASCPTVKVSFVSYTAGAAEFTWDNATQEGVYDRVTQNLGAGTHTLSVQTPNCFYQLDLVVGEVITAFGPYATAPGNFYTPQGRLAASSNGGTAVCTVLTPPTPPAVVNKVTPKKVVKKPKPHKAKIIKKAPKPKQLPYTP